MSESVITALLIILFALAGINVAINQVSSPSERGNTTVVEVVDGDTVDIKRKGGTDTVRILGIDTPEVYSENTPSEFFLKDTEENRKCLRNMGEEASDYAKEKLANQTVEVVQDLQSDKRGSYGRLLGYIEYNQTDLGKQLLKQGYARVYNSSFSRMDEYRELEKESREENRGIWNESCGLG